MFLCFYCWYKLISDGRGTVSRLQASNYLSHLEKSGAVQETSGGNAESKQLKKDKKISKLKCFFSGEQSAEFSTELDEKDSDMEKENAE